MYLNRLLNLKYDNIQMGEEREREREREKGVNNETKTRSDGGKGVPN